MAAQSQPPVRPRSRAEAAILEAFTDLAQRQRYGSIKVADLIAAAGIARSTFYEHFAGKDDALVAAMQPLILALATAASGRAARFYVRDTVEHLWAQRALARPIFDSRAARLIERRLAVAVATHGVGEEAAADLPLFAVGIAASQLAILRAWLAGQVSATVDEVTDQLITTAKLRRSEQ